MSRCLRVLAIALAIVFVVSGTAWARPTYTPKAAPDVTGVELVSLGGNYYQIHLHWDVTAGKPIGAYVWATGVGNTQWPFQKFTRAEVLAGEATLTHSGGGYYFVPGRYSHVYVVLCSRKVEDWNEITSLVP